MTSTVGSTQTLDDYAKSLVFWFLTYPVMRAR